jgi:hypothetical protein
MKKAFKGNLSIIIEVAGRLDTFDLSTPKVLALR